MLFTMASVGLPGTSGFVGEFLVIIGALQVNFWLALLGGIGMILGAAYMLYLYRRVIFGRDHAGRSAHTSWISSPREMAVFAPLVVLTLWMGIYPSSFTSFFDATRRRDGAAPSPRRWRQPRAGGIAASWPGALMNWTLALPEIVLACCGMAILSSACCASRTARSLCTMFGARRLRCSPACWC